MMERERIEMTGTSEMSSPVIGGGPSIDQHHSGLAESVAEPFTVNQNFMFIERHFCFPKNAYHSSRKPLFHLIRPRPSCPDPPWVMAPPATRSEERRVGKEGRSRWSPY